MEEIESPATPGSAVSVTEQLRSKLTVLPLSTLQFFMVSRPWKITVAPPLNGLPVSKDIGQDGMDRGIACIFAWFWTLFYRCGTLFFFFVV